MTNEMRSSRPPKLHLVNIEKVFPIGEHGIAALRGVSLSIEPNEFVAITGISGSGKSTLLHLLGCLDSPSGGAYFVNDRNTAALSLDDLAALRRTTFGYVFQDFALLPDMTAAQNIMLPTSYTALSLDGRRALVERLLGFLRIDHRAGHFPRELSGGQQQRVAIARALINGGSVILADEPTASLDGEMAGEIMSTLSGLHTSGRTVIVSTHDPAVAAFAQRVVQLKDGRVVEDFRQQPQTAALGQLRSLPDVMRVQHHATSPLINRTWDALRSSANQLRTNFLRTALTILGIIIGSAAFVAMVSVGEGQKKIILERMARMGTDVVFVVPKQIPSRGGTLGDTVLNLDDVQAISSIGHISEIAPETSGNIVIKYGDQDHLVRTVATTPAYFKIKRRKTAIGNLFSNQDVFELQPVAVIGSATARALFGDERAAVGRFVVANNVLLQVIGVLSSQGAIQSGQDADDIVIVPMETGRRRVLGREGFDLISLRVVPPELISKVETLVVSALAKERKQEDFRVHNMTAIISAASDTQNSLTWLLASIASLSLLVGGIGIMNVMLMNGLERAREIGIRIAYGARQVDIIALFTAEAFFLAVVGGIAGCILGVAISESLNFFQIASRLTLYSCVLAVAFAASIGVVFGYWPARRAANRRPIDVLGR